jgi:hypothetical protein
MKVLLSAVCLVALSSTAGLSQSRPDFSGTWNMDVSRSEAAAQGTPLGPEIVTIRQTPGEVRIETTREGRSEVVRYLPAPDKYAAAAERVGAFRWDGAKLVTTLIADINKSAVSLQELRSLNPAGTEMTVEVSLVVEHGYQTGGSNILRSQNASNASRGTNVFVKQTP